MERLSDLSKASQVAKLSPKAKGSKENVRENFS